LKRLSGPGDAAAHIELLSQEYEFVWATSQPGAARTRAMELLLAEMRMLGLRVDEAHERRRSLMASGSSGQRLVAIAILQVKPAHDAFLWLAERVATEPPFVGFQAALALLHAAKQEDLEQPEQLRVALIMARRSCGPELVEHAYLLDEALQYLV